MSDPISSLRTVFNNFTYSSTRDLDLPPERGGYTSFANGSNPADRLYVSVIKEKVLTDYMSTWGSEQGSTYYLLHELAHNFPEVKAFENMVAAQYYAANGSYAGYEQSLQFSSIEKVVNTISQQLAQYIGEQVPANMPYGTYP